MSDLWSVEDPRALTFGDLRSMVNRGLWDQALTLAGILDEVLWLDSDEPFDSPAMSRHRHYVRDVYVRTVLGDALAQGIGTVPQAERRDLEWRSWFSRMIDTQQGREYVAETMAAPLRRRIDYLSIGRSVFMVEPLPESDLNPDLDPAPESE